jgi:hypothetical protein
MADDHNQRPYRSTVNPGAAAASPSASDPLAELARLIGQNDPFSEFGRSAAPRAPAAAPAAGWPPQRTPAPPETVVPSPAAAPAELPLYGAPSFGRQPSGEHLYQIENDVPAYGVAPTGVPGYSPRPAAADFEQNAYQPGHPDDFHQRTEDHDDFYDDVPPNRRRIGIIAIAGVFALAVIGTAGAFGYRAIFGSTDSSGPPPVIKADTTPSKIVPAAASKDAQNTKLITDRVNERGQGEKLVSREELPVAVTPSGIPANPRNSAFPPNGANDQASPQLGSGVVGAEPKRVRTIVIHPDGAAATPAAPGQAPAEASPPQRTTSTPAPQPQQRPAPPQRATPPQHEQQAAPAPRPASPAPQHEAPRAAPQLANAPLSLSPDANPPRRAAAPRQTAPAQRTAAAAPPARIAPAAASGGGYVVQVSSQRSEADAQAAFRSLQGKYPNQLGGRQPLIKRVDLGAKGVYYRAMVGPFGSSAEAGELCSKLKTAGGSCLIQRN